MQILVWGGGVAGMPRDFEDSGREEVVVVVVVLEGFEAKFTSVEAVLGRTMV